MGIFVSENLELERRFIQVMTIITYTMYNVGSNSF